MFGWMVEVGIYIYWLVGCVGIISFWDGCCNWFDGIRVVIGVVDFWIFVVDIGG